MAIGKSILFMTILLAALVRSELQCSVPGTCQGESFDEMAQESENNCLERCQNNDICYWYTFDYGSKMCSLFETCPSIDESCSTCVSGQKDCNMQMTKLLVATGYPREKSVISEVIDLNNPSSNCNDFDPYPVDAGTYGAVGGLVYGTSPFICAGDPGNDKCYFLGDSNVQTTMKVSRLRASAIPLVDGGLWITGGASPNITDFNTTEFVAPGQVSDFGPALPDSFFDHCLVELDKESWMIIGGVKDIAPTAGSYILNKGDEEWTPGPNLSASKYMSMCQVLETGNGGEKIVVVAGGYNGTYTDQIETWIVGSEGDFVRVDTILPHRICCAGSVVSSDKKSMILVGGFNEDMDNNNFRTLMKITCDTPTDCKVEQMEQTLRIPRRFPVAMLVPNSITDCN